MKNIAKQKKAVRTAPYAPDELSEKYTGATAENYDAQRIGTAKWEFEQRAVEALLPQCATLLDAPVGTGRFLDLYFARDIDATGLDVSMDMLKVAESKGCACLVHGDFFDQEFEVKFDCVVSMRFLNWFAAPDMARVMARLADLSNQYILLSVTTTGGPAMVKHTGIVIPNEKDFLSLCAENGLSVVGRVCNEQKRGHVANIMLLKKNVAPT